MAIRCIWEHNGLDSLLYAADYPGAFTRGASLEEALQKMEREIVSYMRWCGQMLQERCEPIVVQEQSSDLQICDADSDVLFEAEKQPLTEGEYRCLKDLALKSAADFLRLYRSVPNPDLGQSALRNTFYGAVPRTARQMYDHTKNVNAYYFGEINVDADNDGDILVCRQRGFDTLEQQSDYLQNRMMEGSYGEYWTLRKVLRRFIWHDRIHAKAMYRMGLGTFGTETIDNVFCF